MDPRTMKMLEERKNAAGDGAPSPAGTPDAHAQVTAWLQKHRTPVGVSVAAIVVVWIAWHYLFVTAPAARQEQITQQAQAQAEQAGAQDESLQKCLAEAEAAYTAEIEKACKAKKQGPDCPLPGILSDRIEQTRLDGRIACMRQFAAR